MNQNFFRKYSNIILEAENNPAPQTQQPAPAPAQPIPQTAGKSLSVEQLATISDEALDAAYHYGRSTPGNTFGWQANLASAAYAKQAIDQGETDIEKISDAVHRGWEAVAQKFVDNPDQFSDTEKLRATGKFDKKMADRKAQMVPFNQLTKDQQDIDTVVARAMLKAITGTDSATASESVQNMMRKYSDLIAEAEVIPGDDQRTASRFNDQRGQMAEGASFYPGHTGDNVYGDVVFTKDTGKFGKAGTKVGEMRGYDGFVLDWPYEKELKAKSGYDYLQTFRRDVVPRWLENGTLKVVPSNAQGVVRKDPSRNFGQPQQPGVAEAKYHGRQ